MRKRKHNNQGSTIVLVLVVLALVGILASVALWVTLKNFQMKNTDYIITDNFYSAEGVLEQINAGLQVETSSAIRSAYGSVMENYSDYTEAERNTLFANKYLLYLRNNLRFDGATYEEEDPDGTVNEVVLEATDLQCGLKRLVDKYVPKKLLNSGTVTITSAADPRGYYCEMATSGNGLTLKGIRVEYNDQEKNILSIIETDILIEIPDMNMVSAEMLPDLFSYSLIANQGVVLSNINTNIQGSVFAGSKHSVSSAATSKEDYFGLIVGQTVGGAPTAASVTFRNNPYLVVDGDFYLFGNGNGENRIQTGANGQFWARNMQIAGGDATLAGVMYVADDMTLSGTKPKVYFNSDDGTCTYIGYGNSSTNASESSSIIINGTKSVLDLRALSELQLSGYSFLATGNLASAGSGIANDNVLMGESISVKGDQIAYLVPVQCIGTEGDASESSSKYLMNPLTYSQYQEIINNPSRYTLYNTNVKLTKDGKTLASYMEDGEDVDTHIRKIFVPSLVGNSEGLVYFYLDLAPKQAEKYYLEYYAEASGKGADKLEKYTGFYTESIQSTADDAIIYTAGTSANYDKTKPNGDRLTIRPSIGNQVTSTSVYYADAYKALSKRLVTDYTSLTDQQKVRCLFQNLIKETELAQVTASTGGERVFAAATGLETIHAVVVNGDYSYDSSSPASTKFIIATGDVTVHKDFSGTIITKGRIIVPDANISIASGEEKFFKLLLTAEVTSGSKTVRLADLLVDGGDYLLTSSNGAGAEEQKIKLADLVGYQNWTKK